MKDLFKPASVAILAALAGACVTHGELKKDLYSPVTIPPKTAARVVLVRQPGPPATLIHKELPWVSVDINLGAYPQAVASMLGSLYESVSVATTAAQAQGVDFIVLMSSDYPRTVALSFQNSSGTVVAGFSQPGLEVPDNPDANSLLAKIMMPPAMVVSFGTLGLAFAYRAYESSEQIRTNVSDATSKALVELRRQIAATPVLRHDLTPAGSSAPTAAMCPNPISSYVPPQEAREMFERGRDYLGMAKSAEEYDTAAAEFEKAVALAPCWPSALFSCALAEEGAHHWKQAAQHLRSYLTLSGDVPEAAKLRAKISELESRQ